MYNDGDDAKRAAFRMTSTRRQCIAVCPGSFDPLTMGHVDIIERGSRLFDTIIVAVAINQEKAPLFSLDERIAIVREVFEGRQNVEVDTFGGLLVDYAQSRGA